MLEARGLSKSFGGVLAVDQVNLSLSSGEVVGLAGANGSGKTTLLDLLRGRVKPDKGAVVLDGTVISGRFVSINGNMAQVFRSYQVPRVFPSHTVGENLLLGQWGAANGSRDKNVPTDLVATLPDSSQIAGTLSVGQRRRLILSWLYQRINTVKFFLLDEPSAGGDDEYIQAILEFIRTARDKGKGVLVVEHNQQILSAVADRFLSMVLGQCQASAPPVFSAESQASSADSPLIYGTSALRAEKLAVMRQGAAIIKDTSLAVSPGEILGLIGPNGCGKSTVLLALYGDPTCKYSEGRVMDGNDELPSEFVDLRIRRGIHLLPQEGGTFKSMTVAENLQASVESCCRNDTNPDRIKSIAWTVPHIERIWKRRCGALSGGERRLVGLARILILSPRYALLDEPSTGLDEKSQRAVARLIVELASKGVGVVLAEQTTSSLRNICSREVQIQSRLRSSQR